MIQAHPTQEHLEGYAAGSLSDGLNLLVASHLTYCPICRDKVAKLEALGSALMMDQPVPSQVVPPSVDKALAALDLDAPCDAALDLDAPCGAAVQRTDTGPFPRPILDELETGFSDVAWRFRLPGLHEYVLPGFDGEHVSLLRARPGSGILAHTHESEELTLILSGAMEDGGRVYRQGDVAVADHEDDHRPRIVGDEVCYCLIVMTGNMRFTGRMSRALNVFSPS